MFEINDRIMIGDFEPGVIIKVYPQPNAETRYLVKLGLGGQDVLKESKLKRLYCASCGKDTHEERTTVCHSCQEKENVELEVESKART